MENFVIGNVMFARQAISSILYIGKSSGKQDHYDIRHNDEHWSELFIACSVIDITNFTCILIFLYGLSGKNILEFKKNVSWISPGNLLEICWAGFVDALYTGVHTQPVMRAVPRCQPT